MYWSRLKVFLILVILGMVILGAQLARLQLLHADAYRLQAAKNLIEPTVVLETRRGTIRDRNGLPLAEDVPRFDLCVYYPFLALEDEGFVHRKAAREARPADEVRREMAALWLEPRDSDERKRIVRLKARVGRREMTVREFLDDMADFWPHLAERTAIDIEVIDRHRERVLGDVAAWGNSVRQSQGRDVMIREETYGMPRSVPHVVIEDITERAKAVVAGLGRERPFIVVREQAERRYRHGDLAAHLVGYVGRVAEEKVGTVPAGAAASGSVAEELLAYRFNDLAGKAGIEAAMEHVLRGVCGIERKERGGRVLESEPPRPGRDVILTIDVPFQMEVEAYLSRPPNVAPDYGLPRGAAVVIDLRTGGILVLASIPRYNPNTFYADWQDLSSPDTGNRLLHRAVAARLVPGSVFKCVTATAALHEGVINESTILSCHGVLNWNDLNHFTCMGTHGDITIVTAIRKSCNVFFYYLGLLLGPARLIDWSERLGFGRPVGLPIREGAWPIPRTIDPRNLAIGQGELTVTPLQIARMAALVATGGRMNEVHVIQATVDTSGTAPSVYPADVPTVDLQLNRHAMAVIRQGMRGVVSEGGTGERAFSPLVDIAGKTGSAQIPHREDHSWFLGYAPAGNPQIAFAVVFEHAGYGGKVAAPVARQIVETALRQKIITAQ